MEKITPVISIIVPVYKAELYLRRCLDSLLIQTFHNFEIILINDGSPDTSGTICDEYANKDYRVQVYHIENGGVSAARQFGVNHAIGEYMIHADPDDWIEPNMLEELYNYALKNNSDLVICDYYIDTPNGIKYCKQQPSSLNHDVVLSELFQQLHGSCCNKLVKRSCYNNNNIKFPIGINYCEDLYTWVILLQNPINISYLDKAFYHYDNCINPNSISRYYSFEKYQERRNFYNRLRSELKPEYKYHCNTLLANIAFEAFRHNIFSNCKYRNLFKNDSNIILNSNIKTVIKYLIYFSSIGFYKIAYSIFKLMVVLRKLR